MYLAGDVSLFVQVECFVDLTEPSLADQVEEEVAIMESGVVLESRRVLSRQTLLLSNVQVPLSLELLKLRLKTGLLLKLILQTRVHAFYVPSNVNVLKKKRPCNSNHSYYHLFQQSSSQFEQLISLHVLLRR